MQTPDFKYTLRDLQLIKFGLSFGLIDKDEIIAFADSEILRQEHPAYFWIEVSMMSERPVEDLISLVADRARGPINGYFYLPELHRENMLDVFRLTYRKLLDGCISTETAMRATVLEFRTSDLVTDDEFSEMNGLDYDYCDGIDQDLCTIDEVKQDLLEFLRKYGDT